MKIRLLKMLIIIKLDFVALKISDDSGANPLLTITILKMFTIADYSDILLIDRKSVV